MEKKHRILILIILSAVLAIIIFTKPNLITDERSIELRTSGELIPCSPIYIDDDDPNYNWSKTAAENDWCTGSGTWADPYVINNIYVDGLDTNSSLKIVNSLKPFILKNSVFYNGKSGHGNAEIVLVNTSNGIILNNSIQGHELNAFDGIYISNCHNNTFIENIISNHIFDAGVSNGIEIRNSNNNTFISNTFIDNTDDIYLLYSENNTFRENKFHSGGAIYLVYSIYNYINHNFFYGIYGVEVAYCNKPNYIINNQFNCQSSSIIIYYANLSLMYNNSIGGATGIWLDNADNNHIFENIIEEGTTGIKVEKLSYGNNITKNQILNYQIGISLKNADFNLINSNEIHYCQNTITLSDSHNNSILHNDLIGYKSCIKETNSEDNKIEGNDCQWLDLDPIFIDDTDPNMDWNYTASNYDWCRGCGTAASPYIIENVTINGKNSVSCIEIQNSARKFEIRKNTLYNSASGGTFAGIALVNTQQGKITNNNCSFNNGNGIFLYNSNYTKIDGNILNNNTDDGFSAEIANYVFITNNIVESNGGDGIELHIGHDNEISSNHINLNYRGILVHGDNHDNTIMGNEINQAYNAISIIGGQQDAIIGNNVTGCDHRAISLESTNNHIIWHNNLTDNAVGIYLSFSNANDVTGNNIEGSKYGLYISASDYNIIESNVIWQNDWGISLLNSNYNNATRNTITKNSNEGILVQSSSNNILNSNTISQNDKGLSIIDQSNYNLIYENYFIGNNLNAEDNSYILTSYSHLEDTCSPAEAVLYTGSFGSTPEGLWWFTDAYKDNDGRYLYLDSTWGNDYPGTIYLRWGEYQDFSDSIANSIYSITINYEVWPDSYPGVLDESSNLRIRAYDNLGNSVEQIIASTPGNRVHYYGSMIISSGSVFDTVKAGGYIQQMAVLMYCNEELWTHTWINIDYVDIYYNYLVDDPCENQWDNGVIGNYWSNYTGYDANDDGIGDDPNDYLISGTAGRIDHYPIFSDKFELLMDIIPLFEECYMGDDIKFNITLSDLFGDDVNIPLEAIEQYAYWDAHNHRRTHFSSLNNLSGTLFHNETGTPSFATSTDIYMLNYSMYPYSSIIVAPEILEYNPSTFYSRQRIETYIQLDLDFILNLYGLDVGDISYIDATLFGAHFLESNYISDILQSFGSIEIYNYQTDSYRELSNQIYNQALELGNINNPLSSDNITDFTFGFDANELKKYIDPNNVITFRFYSYFKGYLSNPQDSYLSNFKNNAVLGTLLDYISFDVIWWKENPEQVFYQEISPAYPRVTYSYTPTCPGTYSIIFRTLPHANYSTIEVPYIITVKRRPVNISLDLPSQVDTTLGFSIIANVSDYLTNTPAIRAKVNFYSNLSGIINLLGSAISDSSGLAKLELKYLPEGSHKIYAEVVQNHGQHVMPFRNERFTDDMWDMAQSPRYDLLVIKSSTQLELSSLAPEGFNVTAGQNFFVYPMLIDLTNGDEIYYENLIVFVNGIEIGSYNSSQPFLISFLEPGEQVVEVFYSGSSLYKRCNTSSVFNVERLQLTITEISPPESILIPNQIISITISALDLAFNLLPIENLEINLYYNGTFLASGFTGSDGKVTFQVQISEDWAGKYVNFYAINTLKPGFYLERRTQEVPLRIRPFITNASLEIQEEYIYAWELSGLNFSLINLDTLNLIEYQDITITISNNEYLDEFIVTTGYNNFIQYNFTSAGIYNITVHFSGTDLYLPSVNIFTIEILKRPTYLIVDITDLPLVPENEFFITVRLIDTIRDQVLLNKYIEVLERIYENGSIVEEKIPFLVNTEYTNTFQWIPLRAAEFEFICTFNYDEFNQDPIYQFANYSAIYEVKKRNVFIDTSVNENTFRIGDILKINSTFTDMNTTDSDPIPDLIVHYLIRDGDTILYSENHTTNNFGKISFEWQIPSSLINRTFTVSIITAKTNVYHYAIQQVELSTLPLESFFNIIVSPVTMNYITEEIFFDLELFSVRGDIIQESISYTVEGETSFYFETGVIDLAQTQIFSTALSAPDRYIFTFFYNGSELYSATSRRITYFIELYPSSLELINYPQFIYSTQSLINLTYLLRDTFTQEPISGSEIRLYYVDFDSSLWIDLGFSLITDFEGRANFSITLPETYSYSSVILIAEADETSSNKASSNTIELFITKTPTYINIDTSRVSDNYYVDESLTLTFELFDYFGDLLIAEPLEVLIETPMETLILNVLSSHSIQLNFTDLGLYDISVAYSGSDEYLTSECQTYFAASPVSTSLEFIEPIPDILYSDQFLFLRAQLTNNITHLPIEGKTIRIFIANETSTILIFEGLTDSNGIISYIWEVNPALLNQIVEVFALYDYEYYYQESSTENITLFLSRYNVNLSLIEFPEIITPLTEHRILIQAMRENSGEVAQNCRLQTYILLPNGSKILLIDSFTDSNGFLEFYWIPTDLIFKFSEITFEFFIIENELYNEEFELSELVPVEKLQPSLIIFPEKYQVLQGEEILIDFDLVDIFGKRLLGETINVEIRNPLYSNEFTIVIGYNDSYNFLIPSYGVFEIEGTYEGNDRNNPCSNKVTIFSEKFHLNIELSILEAFIKNKSVDFCGSHWNYSVLDYQQNFTIIANVSCVNPEFPLEGIIVKFYFLQHFQEPLLLGTNYTNSEGVAIFHWDTSNYSLPNWRESSAIFAKIEETDYNYAAESDPIYITLRKINTFISIDTITSYFRIDVPYRINFTLYDEFWNILDGFNLNINVIDRFGRIVEKFQIETNKTSYVYFTPSKLGRYKIKASFSGTEQYHESQRIKLYRCIEKEPTKISIIIPNYIRPGHEYNISIRLVNSTGGNLFGELVKVAIMYHADTGKTEYYYVDVIIGKNSTFNWIFPESNDYIIKATYEGSNEYKPCRDTHLSRAFVIFRFSFWELFFFLLGPCVLIIPSPKEKKSRWNKKKSIIAAIFVILFLLGSMYAGVGDICSQIETTGLIKDLNGESDYEPNNPIVDFQAHETFNDVFDYGASQISKIDMEHIPNLENETSPYDIIVKNATIIPPEADENPPVVRFISLSSGDTIFGTKNIELDAYDRETGVQKIVFKMLFQDISTVFESEFNYNETFDSYSFNLNTANYEDGEYGIYAIAYDYNNNSKTISANVKILNNPNYDFEEFEIETIATELTDDVNISFTSLENGRYNIQIADVNTENTIMYLTGNVSKGEFVKVEIPIDPFLFKAGLYKILVSVSIRNDLLYYKSEIHELILQVMKESVRLKLDIVEGDDLYSNHYIHLRAKLIENDFHYTDDGYAEEDTASPSIPGQKLSFEIADSDYKKYLGSVITDANGEAILIYNLTLSKGLHVFNVTFGGNNLYKPLEGMKVFDNKGKFVDIHLSYFSTPVAYNEIGTIQAKLYGDADIIPEKSLYFNISNSIENYYLGMAMTNANGEATIRFPCNVLPGVYDISVGYDGDTEYAKNVTIFRDKFEVVPQDVDLSILVGEADTIYCPFKYNSELNAKILVNNSDIGIDGVLLHFKLISDEYIEYPLGNVLSDSNGRATINFNPSEYQDILPGHYYLVVQSEITEYYSGAEYIVDLIVSKDIPIISIQVTDTLYNKDFTLNATLTDSLLNPIGGELLYFSIISDGDVLYSNPAWTNMEGKASLLIRAGEFNYIGKFDIAVNYPGNNLFSVSENFFSEALNVIPIQTDLKIQGPEKGNVIEPYEIEVILLDSEGIPVPNQIIYIECYKEDGITNLLRPNTHVITDSIYGNTTFSINITLPGRFIIKAYYKPLSDDSTDNDGFLSSHGEISFTIERVSADLSITQRNLPFIMRGDKLIFKVETGLKEAKEDIVPINIFVDTDLDGDGIINDDIFRGSYRFIENGIAIITYTIPRDGTFQAGEYNFSVVIDEEWSRFTGTTWFLVDLVERTTLSITYHFPNSRTEGKHYIWEKEIVEFTLLDEDGKPLVEKIEVQNGSQKSTNRIIQYQILNGKSIYDNGEVNLDYGNFSIEHAPTTFGYETRSVYYKGSRFFAPTRNSEVVHINRRPLILNFLDFHHNNEERTDTPHSGHRGEIIIITASVQDYLNLSFLKDQEVCFGFNGRYLTISNSTNEYGIVKIEVPLTEKNGLIQAGIYDLQLKIEKTDNYQFISSSAVNKLYIFERGYVEYNVGPITVADFNYVLKPTVYFYDEDGQVITDVPFYLQVLDETGEVVYEEFMYSGMTEIPFYDSGNYHLVFTITDDIDSFFDDIEDLVDDFLNNTQYFEEWFDKIIRVIDEFVRGVIIPFISNVLEYALTLCVNWEGAIWTFLILILLNLLMGYINADLSFTWFTLLKVLVVSVLFGLVGYEKTYYRYLGYFGVIAGLFLLVSAMRSIQWLIIGLAVVLIFGGIYLLKRKDIKRAEIAQKQKFDLNLILLELLILCIAGILELIGDALGIFKIFAGTLAFNIWLVTHEFAPLAQLMPLGSLVLFILVVAIIDSIITPLLYLIFPPSGGLWGFIKTILRNALRWALIAFMYVLITIYFTGATEILAMFAKSFGMVLITFFIEAFMGQVFGSHQFQTVVSQNSQLGFDFTPFLP